MRYKVNENGCWVWTGAVDHLGYGVLKISGKKLYAHRVSYSVHNGTLKPGNVVRHECDNPSCINPNHLKRGTHSDNVMDRVRRRRSACGERNGRTKVDRKLASEILDFMSNRGARNIDAANKFLLDPKTISNITNGKHWTQR